MYAERNVSHHLPDVQILGGVGGTGNIGTDRWRVARSTIAFSILADRSNYPNLRSLCEQQMKYDT